MASANLNYNTYSPVANKRQPCKLSVNKKSQQGNVYLSKINTIIFDLDNTLIPTRYGDSKTCRKVSESLEIQYGFSKEEANYTTQNFLKSFRRCPDNVQKSLETWRIHLWRESLPSKYKHLAISIYPLWLEIRYRYLAIPEDYVEMLIRFRQAKYQLVLITNGPSNAQWEKIRKLHVQSYFDRVLVSSDLPWEKPDPNIFYAACKYLNVKSEQCSMIGDKLETDIKGGNLAGLGATFWIPLTLEAIQNLHNEDVECRPTHILRNLLDLYKYFNINVQKEEIIKQVPAYNNQSNKYRRASSLPTIEYLTNSEKDISSDSIN